MANIKITIDGALMDGHKVSFKAPCDCITVEKLKVCYVENGTQKSRLFTMRDSHNNDLTGLGNLFSEGAIVYAVLDTEKGYAYLQNAGTNAYLEGKMTPVDNLESDRADLPLSARQGKLLNESLGVDIKLIDGVPNWSERGADTWSPFSNNIKFRTISKKTTSLSEQFSLKSGESIFAYIGSSQLATPLSISGDNYISIITDPFISKDHFCSGKVSEDSTVTVNCKFSISENYALVVLIGNSNVTFSN